MIIKAHYWLLFILCTLSMHARVTYIIVHGTWGATSQWHQPEGDFYIALEKSAKKHKACVKRFVWDGAFSHASRTQAGEKLALMIEKKAKKGDVNIVAHSHGVNVAIIASNILAQRQKQDNKSGFLIKNLYGFGTPVDTTTYLPNMDIIERIYNFFSPNDGYQRLYKRTYPIHDRIANIRVTIDSQHPSHTGIRAPIIADWIPSTHNFDDLIKSPLGNFHTFDCTKQSVIHFITDEHPRHEIENDAA